MLNKERQAGAKDDSSTEDEYLRTVRRHNTNALVGGSFFVRKISFAKCRYDKNKFRIEVVDLTDTYKNVHAMFFQFWFKKGFAIMYELHESNPGYYGKVVLLKNYNVVHDEIVTNNRFKAVLIGLIWRFVPDMTFQKRRYMIVDVS